MLKKIEGKEIMTTWEARNKYRDYFFLMVITEGDGGRDEDKGYVIYIYDDKKEMYNIDYEPYNGLIVGSEIGVAAEKGIHIGGITIHEKF